MSSFKVNPNKLRNVFYSIMILLPSFLTGNVYSTVDNEQSASSIFSSLSAINTSLGTSLSDLQNDLSYSTKLLLSHIDFTSFNIEGMGKHASQFLYYSPTVENIYIIDSNYEVVYGTNDTLLSGVNYTNHIDAALKGSFSFYNTFINNTPFAQFALPITSGEPESDVLGAIVFTYDFVPLEEQLKSLNSSSVDLHAYLFDQNGRILATSSNLAPNIYTQSVDISLIKQGISYSYDTSFKLFDDTPLIGVYHTIQDNDWTLLITSASPEGETDLATQGLSLVSGLFGLSGIAMLEGVRKKKASPLLESLLDMATNIPDDLSNNTPNTNADTHTDTDTDINTNANTDASVNASVNTNVNVNTDINIDTTNTLLSKQVTQIPEDKTHLFDPGHWDSSKEEV